jgi:hypothetical protein
MTSVLNLFYVGNTGPVRAVGRRDNGKPFTYNIQ